MKKLPKVLVTEECTRAIEELDLIAREFRRTVIKAVKRRKCCCSALCCGFNKMFGTIE